MCISKKNTSNEINKEENFNANGVIQIEFVQWNDTDNDNNNNRTL